MNVWEAVFEHRIQPVPEAGCWIFQGAWTSAGYANVGFLGQNHLGHRLSFMLAGNALRDDAFLCHRCDTPACVNPDHMMVGDPKVNAQDMARKRRNHGGSQHYRSLLTEEVVEQIRASDESDPYWAERLGVSRATVCFARNGKTWARVGSERVATKPQYRTKGDECSWVKLTDAQCIDIHRDPRENKLIATEYGVSSSHVWLIKNEKTRKHLWGEPK